MGRQSPDLISLLQRLLNICMKRERIKMHCCPVSFPHINIAESYCWPSQGAFTQWDIIASLIVLSKTLHTRAAAVEMRASIKKKNDAPCFYSFSLLMGLTLFFSGSSEQPARRLFFTSTPHLPQSAQWQINPVGLLWVLCLQMARCADGALWCTGDCKGNLRGGRGGGLTICE